MPTAFSIAKGLTPPYAARAVRKALDILHPPKIDEDALFDGEGEIFRDLAAEAKVYFEYGCGKSTIWVSKHTSADIFSVDTSSKWVRQVRRSASRSNLPNIEWVNCGPVADWGMPRGYQLRSRFSSYFTSPFDRCSVAPDLILIDGRFRVASFLTAILLSPPGTKILFDDYMGRQQYHIVEEYCDAPSIFGRQALFLCPMDKDRAALSEEIRRFAYVLD